jgi:hypothetical protein
MPLLNEADEIHFGSDPAPADQICLGDTEVWVPTQSAAQFSDIFTILQVVGLR